MHYVLEGVVSWLLKAWTEPKFCGEPFSICHRLDQIDETLLRQQSPHEFTRPPRSIRSYLSYWKASELRQWSRQAQAEPGLGMCLGYKIAFMIQKHNIDGFLTFLELRNCNLSVF